MARPITLPRWPDGAQAAVSLTFDMDADPAWLGKGGDYARRLSTLSQARYGVVRGLPRILDLLQAKRLRATFYVPGATAARYAAEVREIAGAGHEIGHHGHDHLRPDVTDERLQREEIERGLEAIHDAVGQRPRGYRAPFAELTPETLALLLEHGFDYDSSCMGDDRPYVEVFEDLAILELPLHWSLDDYPYFGFDLDDGGLLRDPSEVLRLWTAELNQALVERRHVTYVMHPEVMGRGPQVDMLARFIDELSGRADIWCAPHADVADLVGPVEAPTEHPLCETDSPATSR